MPWLMDPERYGLVNNLLSSCYRFLSHVKICVWSIAFSHTHSTLYLQRNINLSFIRQDVCAYLRLNVVIKMQLVHFSALAQQECWILNAYLNCYLLTDPLRRAHKNYAETSNYESNELYQFSNAARDVRRAVTSTRYSNQRNNLFSASRFLAFATLWYVRNSQLLGDIASGRFFYSF